MRAIIHDPAAEHGLAFAERPSPSPTSSQALVEVHATSLNFGETRFVAELTKAGGIPGWDSAGIVARPAADGSGPKKGARVVGFGGSGAWAEERAIEVAELTELPEGVDFGVASAVPVAGVTALRALRQLGAVVGRRVLVTGASGGVGRFAVRLAHLAGAHVIASVGSEAHGKGLAELGADEVVVGLSGVSAPVFGVLENVGGKVLGEAFALVGPGGSLQSIGMASNEASTLDFEEERRRASGRRIDVFVVGGGFAADLTYLLALVGRKELEPQIGWQGGWDRIDEAVTALLDRKVTGKVVLDVRKEGAR